jgi:hypothetical protein
MRAADRTRAASVALAVMLAAGFVYSGIATLRQVRLVFQAPRVAGRSASIDAYLAPMNLSSGEDLRRAARCLGPISEEIVLLADGPTLSRDDLRQISYAAGYLLYPRRVAITGSDPMTKNVIRLSLVERH